MEDMHRLVRALMVVVHHWLMIGVTRLEVEG